MAELLLYALDTATLEPELSREVIAGRMKLFDLVTWQVDGWGWGEMELISPSFRIVSWAGVSEGQCQQLMSTPIEEWDPDQEPLNLAQPRGYFMNLLDPRIVSAMPPALAWWRDTSRAAPIWTMPEGFALSISDVITARPAMPVIP